MAKSRPLPQWPAGRKTITINEIAEMVLEFQFPSAPMAEEYNSDLQAAAFEKLINEPGRIDDTFEDHDQRRLARQAIFEKEHEKGVRATVEGTVREEQIRLMVTWLLSIAHSSTSSYSIGYLGIFPIWSRTVDREFMKVVFRK